MNRTNVLTVNGLAALLALAVAAMSPARADVIDPAAWSVSGPGTQSVTSITGGVDLTYSYDSGYCGGCGGRTWDFSTTAGSSGAFGFNWEQSDNYAYFDASGSLDLIDITSGASVNLNMSPGTIYSGPIFGVASLDVSAGDTIVVKAYGSNNDSQPSIGGDVQLTSFTGAAVPEPMSLALLGAGLGSLGLVRRRRKP